MRSTPKRSVFRHVADVIRKAIADGEYPRGSALPKEDELADELGVSRATVNDAVRVLVAEGLVRVHRGVGMFVTELPPIVRNAAARYSTDERERGRGAFDVEVKALGRTSRVRVRIERVAPPARVAEILKVSPNEPSTVARIRHMGADDIPLQVATSYIPVEIAAGTAIEQEDTGPGGIISRFAELGHKQVRITESVTARPPTAEEISYLAMTEDQRVFEIFHTGWTAEARAVEVCVHVMPTHAYVLDYEWMTV
ncbi:GntR family transcriptional regulator [Nonomuraea typhae]|uniref:GntR family transcriptional regulator n=1 Tax=Nonomuraea typhae TaxID=2603600 RepID=UPI0012FCB18D|nr:GntR family transcriptional regulator [Nonomuraea typhae]